MARAIWKGHISFGLVNVPVALHTAETSDELSFSLLDRRDLSPVGYSRINKATGEEVPWGEIVKGYEYAEDSYVVLGDEDFRRANAEATQTIEIVAFVERQEIDPVFFERPYYLAPAKKGAKGYALLREALRRTDKVGIARVVIRTREHLAAVLPRGEALVLMILRYAFQLRDMDDLGLPAEEPTDLGLSDKEIKMAERLIEGMVEEWDPAQYHDTYRDDLLKLIEKKVASGDTETVAEPVEVEEAPDPKVVDIMTLLKRSVEKVDKSKPKPKAKTARAKAPAKKRKRA